MTEPEPEKHRSLVPDAIGEVVAALAGAGIGGPTGAVVGAAITPFALELAKRAYGELSGRRGASVASMLSGAAAELGEDMEEMLATAMADDQRAQHLADAMQAAANTFNEQKIAALSQALANGLRDGGARVDVENLIVHALADLEAPHIRALAGFCATSKGRPKKVNRERGANASIYATLERHALIVSDEESRQHKAIEQALQERLAWWNQELGRIARTRSPIRRTAPALQLDLEPRWYITGFGSQCLKYLLKRGARSERPLADPEV